jgi:hypothetical protein
MDPTVPTAASDASDASAGSLTAYPRTAVEDFLAAAAGERRRLEGALADADTRIRRARAAVGMHRVMASMLLQLQVELTERRATAEAEAEKILERAEREARELVLDAQRRRGAQPAAAIDDPQSSWVRGARSGVNGADREIDLTEVEEDGHPGSEPPVDAECASWDGPYDAAQDGDGDHFFAFLRGALADDQPLGPALA